MKSAVAHDAALGVALATAEEATEEMAGETTDMITVKLQKEERLLKALSCEECVLECCVCAMICSRERGLRLSNRLSEYDVYLVCKH